MPVVTKAFPGHLRRDKMIAKRDVAAGLEHCSYWSQDLVDALRAMHDLRFGDAAHDRQLGELAAHLDDVHTAVRLEWEHACRPTLDEQRDDVHAIAVGVNEDQLDPVTPQESCDAFV